MATASKNTLKVQMKPRVRRRLANLARASGRSTDFLVNDAVESYILDYERMMEDVAVADRQLSAGHFIKHAEVKAWVASLVADPNAPPPTCACGKKHNGLSLCR